MMHALIDANGTVVETRSDIDLKDAGTKYGFRWVPVEQAEQPAFDAATQVCEPTETLGKDALVRGWAVRAKTADEIDAAKTSRVSAMNEAALKALFDHENRIRALEGKGAITAAQFKNAVKALL